MIDFLKTWANQIIVAVIIATIIEMILPNGNNKKYIKMVIGIYVLFTIIQPIITKVTGNSFEISDFNYEKYLDEEVLETSTQDFEDNNSKLIKQAYIDNIKSDIKAKVEQKGYEVINCNINIMNTENKDNYGVIESVVLKIQKPEKEPEHSSNTIEIKEVEIEINNDSNNNIEKSNITEEEKRKIIEYLASEYMVDKKIIVIN